MIEMGIAKPDLIREAVPAQPPGQPAHCPPEPEPEPEYEPAPAPAPAREAPDSGGGVNAPGGQVLTFAGGHGATATFGDRAQVVPVHAPPDTAPSAEAEPVQHPAAGVARARDLAAAWAAEAYHSGRAALDGSVWRTRPAALRDLHARIERAEWAGGIEALRLAGQGYGYVALVLVAGLYALAEVIKRPSRLAIAVLIVLIAVLAF